MIKGTTNCGFEFCIDPTALDDMRVVDAMSIAVDPNAKPSERLAANAKATELILGKHQKQQLYDHIGKSNGGRVPVAAFETVLAEILSFSGKDAEKN